jgi:hypothetical protein
MQHQFGDALDVLRRQVEAGRLALGDVPASLRDDVARVAPPQLAPTATPSPLPAPDIATVAPPQPPAPIGLPPSRPQMGQGGWLLPPRPRSPPFIASVVPPRPPETSNPGQSTAPQTAQSPSVNWLPAAPQNGYDPTFLSSAAGPLDLPTVRAGAAGAVVRSGNFSVTLDPVRRVARVAAANLDRPTLRILPRPAPAPWQPAASVPADSQPAMAWTNLPGAPARPLVTGREVSWGPGLAPTPLDAALQVEAGTAILPNAALMTRQLGERAWLQLGDWMVARHNPAANRVTIFSGPVLAPDDPVVDGVALPRRFWKLAVSTRPGASIAPAEAADGLDLFVDAFLLPQFAPDSDEPLPEADFAPELFRVSVADLEALTGLNLGHRIRQADAVGQAFAAEQARSSAVDPLAPLVEAISWLGAEDRSVRLGSTQTLVAALRDGGLPAADQPRLVTGLLSAAAQADLSAPGLVNALFVLSEVPADHWARPAWSGVRSGALGLVAELSGRKAETAAIGPQARTLLQKLRSRLG